MREPRPCQGRAHVGPGGGNPGGSGERELAIRERRRDRPRPELGPACAQQDIDRQRLIDLRERQRELDQPCVAIVVTHAGVAGETLQVGRGDDTLALLHDDGRALRDPGVEHVFVRLAFEGAENGVDRDPDSRDHGREMRIDQGVS
ncbi:MULTISPECIES: hypothetical protein [Microbacterium]|uniref:hypothetical protein n=1 Tax=Microbacterium TaxID=33882 RepID=UPI0011EB6D9C|nr:MULTISPECIES: hypothetical protein [Microbacterium]